MIEIKKQTVGYDRGVKMKPVNNLTNIKIDEKININIYIPKEMEAEEFRTLFEKANKMIRSVAVFDISDITTKNQSYINRTSPITGNRISPVAGKRLCQRWTEEQISSLKKLYQNTPKEELKNIFNRSMGSISQKAKELNLHRGNRKVGRPKTYQKWSPKDKEILKKSYSSKSKDELINLLNHPIGSIYEKAKKMGLHRGNVKIGRPKITGTGFHKYLKHSWTEKEVDFLLRNYGKMKNREIGEHLGISGKQVIDKYNYIKKHK